MHRILLVDEHPYLHEGLTMDLLLRQMTVLHLVEFFDFRTQIEELKPDILVLDMSLADPYGTGSVISGIKESYPRLPVIVLGVFDEYREEPAVKLADAFVLKNPDTTQLRAKILEFIPHGGGGSLAV